MNIQAFELTEKCWALSQRLKISEDHLEIDRLFHHYKIIWHHIVIRWCFLEIGTIMTSCQIFRKQILSRIISINICQDFNQGNKSSNKQHTRILRRLILYPAGKNMKYRNYFRFNKKPFFIIKFYFKISMKCVFNESKKRPKCELLE